MKRERGEMKRERETLSLDNDIRQTNIYRERGEMKRERERERKRERGRDREEK
jgi:hypothetical protein